MSTMLPPRRSSYAPYAASAPPPPSESPSPDAAPPRRSQLRSRLLGQEEQQVMLALGLVRAAERALLELEPKLARAAELLGRFETPREAAARLELKKLYDELSREVAGATFEGRPIFERTRAVFDVNDARRNGEPLTIALPDLDAVVHGEHGLAQFLGRARIRFEVERMVELLASTVSDGKQMLSEADHQLSVLLTHFHAQRRERNEVEPTDLERAATRLREQVQRAGHAALSAQGELSTRASSLVLSERPPR